MKLSKLRGAITSSLLLICSSTDIDQRNAQKLGYTANVSFISPLKTTQNKTRKQMTEKEREREPKSDYLSWGLLSPSCQEVNSYWLLNKWLRFTEWGVFFPLLSTALTSRYWQSSYTLTHWGKSSTMCPGQLINGTHTLPESISAHTYTNTHTRFLSHTLTQRHGHTERGWHTENLTKTSEDNNRNKDIRGAKNGQ